MVNTEIKASCPFEGGHEVAVDQENLTEPSLVHCQAWMNFCLSGGCRFDGCVYLHPHAIKHCPFNSQGRVVGVGYVRPKNYWPLFLNESEG